MPPIVPHAVITGLGYREVFAADSQLKYECEEGYAIEDANKIPIVCIAGDWTEGPTCSKWTSEM